MVDKITTETIVNPSELACTLGITARRIRQLAEDGVIKKISEGKYNLCDAVQQYISFLSSKEKNISRLIVDKEKAEVKLKQAKAEIAEMEAAELKGNMHRSEDVAALTEDLIYSIRGMLISLPGRLAVDTSNAETPAQASEIIKKEVYSIMNELADYKYDPKKYEERVRERKAWSDADDDTESTTNNNTNI